MILNVSQSASGMVHRRGSELETLSFILDERNHPLIEGFAVVEFQTKRLQDEFELAPDGSEIRPLIELRGGSFAHCTLQPRRTSLAVSHRSVDEIWYFFGGEGEVWRRQGGCEEVVEVGAGVCLTIPQGTHFQFRNTGGEPLRFLIATIPPWPGDQEAVGVVGRWKPSSGRR
jgi:mannose-6-phosphate isomerase-like protein (cupin superfamily)